MENDICIFDSSAATVDAQLFESIFGSADACGVNDGNFSRKLRKELSQDEKQRIFEAIDRLAQEKREVL